VDDGIAALERALHGSRVAEVGLDLAQVGMTADLGEHAFAVYVEIQHRDFVALPDQLRHKVAAYVTGAARHQHRPGFCFPH
jgi:hypothetical protein